MPRGKKEVIATIEQAPDGAWVPPQDLALCADLLYTTRETRLEMDKQVAELKAKETALREHLIENLPVSNATGIAGRVARATVVTKEEPVAEDWDATFEYIRKKKAFFLLQKRLSGTAVKEMWADGKQVPGVGHMIVKSISLNKVK